MTLDARLDLILASAPQLEPYTGKLTRALLAETFQREATAPTARLPQTIVHIISGNTPHAAYQSLLNGILLGAQNLLKLPSQGLLDFQIPPGLAPFVEVARDLPDHWIERADALVVFGSDETIRHFQNLCPLEIPFIGHGHRVGIALITDASAEAARLAARDIGLFNQSGCLSLQTIFLENPREFGPLLARAMADFEKENPRGPLSLSESGAITNLREEIRYLAAQAPENHTLWHSPDSTAWTIIHQADPALTLSPGNRTVFLRPLPADFLNCSDLPKVRHLSGIALYPFTEVGERGEEGKKGKKGEGRPLPSPRLFPLGQAQSPPALWAHDGLLPLASLITHQSTEPIPHTSC